MRGPVWLREVACTTAAMTLFCVLLCGGQFLLSGLLWLLNAVGANVLVVPAFVVGMLGNLVLSFILGGKLAQWLIPRADA